MSSSADSAVQTAPLRSPWITVLAAWLVPGAGHFLLGRRGRGGLLMAAVVVSFVIGILLQGPMFQVTPNSDVLSRLIQYGGILGDLASGVLYFAAVLLGYAPPDRAGHTADYGSKFIVAAGLMNILAMVDAFEIAKREKD